MFDRQFLVGICLLFSYFVSIGVCHAQPCNTSYINGVRPVLNIGQAPVSLVFCNTNLYAVPAFVNDYFESNFNTFLMVPNYVGYCLDPTRYTALTTGWWINAKFDCCGPDPRLDPGFQGTADFTYTAVDIDAGHMFPAASANIALDSKGYASYLTNIAPQVAALNRGLWETLEDYIRGYSSVGSIYVLVGATYTPGALVRTSLQSYPTAAVPAPAPPARQPTPILADGFFMLIYQPPQPAAAEMRLAYWFPNRKTQYQYQASLPPPPGAPGLPTAAPFYVPPANIAATILTPAGLTYGPLVALFTGPAKAAIPNNNCGTPIP
jgi:hypothetical protein